MTKIRIQALPKFPASVEAGDGMIITRSAGVFMFAVDPDFFPSFSSALPLSVGDMLIADGASSIDKIAAPVGPSAQTLVFTGTGKPGWAQLPLGSVVTGTLAVANGGTGALTLTGLVKGNGTSAMTAVPDSSTGGQVLRVTGAATYAWGPLDLANVNAITGDLPFDHLAQGSALSVLGVAGNAAADVASVAAGSDLQVLRRSGTSIGFGAIDISNSAVVGASRLQLGNLVQGPARSVLGVTGNAAADYVAMQGTTNQVMRVDNTGTGVAFGAINLTSSAAVNGALPVGNGGTGLASGTSGGIPYFSSSGTVASSGALTANAIIKGGGAGATPSASGVSIDSSNNVTGVNALTTNAASTFNVPTSNIGAFTFNVQTPSNSVGINFADNSISKWVIYKDNGNGLNFRDMTNNLDVGGFTQGAGVTSKLSTVGSQVAHSGTAIPAGGTAGAGHMFSSTSNFGLFFGSGVPTLSAAKGSLYLRSDGTTTNDRMYVNTNGSTTWTAVTTAA